MHKTECTLSVAVLPIADVLFFFNFYCYSITVVCIFSPSLHPTPDQLTSLPHLHLPPSFCPSILYSSSCKPLSTLSPPHYPLAIVRLFLTSMPLVTFCLVFSFVDYVNWAPWQHAVLQLVLWKSRSRCVNTHSIIWFYTNLDSRALSSPFYRGRKGDSERWSDLSDAYRLSPSYMQSSN